VAWRQINEYGIRIDYRTYDSPGLGPWRRQHSGITARRGLWEVHQDPYDLSQVFVRTPDAWVTVPWTHLPMISAPFADFTWRPARKLTAQAGRDDTSETDNDAGGGGQLAAVVPFGVFDADAEASRW